MEKTVQIDGRPVKFRATASIPRLYRLKFGRDVIQDMAKLRRDYKAALMSQNIPADATEDEKKELEQNAELSVLDLTIFENISYLMAKHADPDGVPSDIGEWLDGFETFSIYEILPQIIDLWGDSTQSTSTAKNLHGRQHAH